MYSSGQPRNEKKVHRLSGCMCSPAHSIPSLHELSDVAALRNVVSFKRISSKNIAFIHEMSVRRIAIPSNYFTSRKSFDITTNAVAVYHDAIGVLHREHENLVKMLEAMRQELAETQCRRDEAVVDVIQGLEKIKEMKAKGIVLREKHCIEEPSSADYYLSPRNELRRNSFSSPLGPAETQRFLYRDCQTVYPSDYFLRSHGKKRHGIRKDVCRSSIVSYSSVPRSASPIHKKHKMPTHCTPYLLQQLSRTEELQSFREEIRGIRNLLDRHQGSCPLSASSTSKVEGIAGTEDKKNMPCTTRPSGIPFSGWDEDGPLPFEGGKNKNSKTQQTGVWIFGKHKESEESIAAAYRSLRKELPQQREQIQKLCQDQKEVLQLYNLRKNEGPLCSQRSPEAKLRVKGMEKRAKDSVASLETNLFNAFSSPANSSPFCPSSISNEVGEEVNLYRSASSSRKIPVALSSVGCNAQDLDSMIECSVVAPMGSSKLNCKNSLTSPSSSFRCSLEDSASSNPKRRTENVGVALPMRRTEDGTRYHAPVSPSWDGVSSCRPHPFSTPDASMAENSAFIAVERPLPPSLSPSQDLVTDIAEDESELATGDAPFASCSPHHTGEGVVGVEPRSGSREDHWRSASSLPSFPAHTTPSLRCSSAVEEVQRTALLRSTVALPSEDNPSMMSSPPFLSPRSVHGFKVCKQDATEEQTRSEVEDEKHSLAGIFSSAPLVPTGMHHTSFPAPSSPIPSSATPMTSTSPASDVMNACGRSRFPALPVPSVSPSHPPMSKDSSAHVGASSPSGRNDTGSLHANDAFSSIEKVEQIQRETDRSVAQAHSHEAPTTSPFVTSPCDRPFLSLFMPPLLEPLLRLSLASSGSEPTITRLELDNGQKNKMVEATGIEQAQQGLPFVGPKGACLHSLPVSATDMPLEALSSPPVTGLGSSFHDPRRRTKSVALPIPTPALPSCSLADPTAASTFTAVTGQEVLLLDHASRDPEKSPMLSSSGMASRETPLPSGSIAYSSASTSSSYTYLYPYSESDESHTETEGERHDLDDSEVTLECEEEEVEDSFVRSYSGSGQSGSVENSKEKDDQKKRKEEAGVGFPFLSDVSDTESLQREAFAVPASSSSKKKVGNIFKHLLSKSKKK